VIPSTPACASCRLPLKSDAVKVFAPDGAVLYDACANFLGYLPGQQLDAGKRVKCQTLNGRIHALEILVEIYRVPNVQRHHERLDDVEDATGLPRSEGDTRARLKVLEVAYGDRVRFPIALWRLAAMLPEPWRA
jgi:hypothetical protein